MEGLSDKTKIKRDLLFGVVAVRLKFLNSADLARVVSTWTKNIREDLGAILVAQKIISADDRALIDAIVQREIDLHDHDAGDAINSFGGDQAIHETFAATITYSHDQITTIPSDPDALSAAPPQDPSTIQTTPSALLGPAAKPHDPDLADFENITIEHPGRYLLIREHARGGAGRVLIAHDSHINRQVAMKEILPELRGGPKQRRRGIGSEIAERFLREARITGQLNHPAIVPVHEIAKHADGTLYYTMRLVVGKTLAQLLRERPALADRLKLLPNFQDVCNAVAHAHAKGVIHRDLKPQNIMLGEFGETVVLDWGLAKAKGAAEIVPEADGPHPDLIHGDDLQLTLPGALIGTPCYMSPEQGRRQTERVDERSDVWALGTILYEILTGRPPFLGKDINDVIHRITHEREWPIHRIEPDAPAELRAIAERCLDKDQDRRYQNAGELAADVAEVTLVMFGPMSFVQVRNERNEALEQKRIADEQRRLAEEQRRLAEEQRQLADQQRRRAEAREREARENLSEAYFQYGLLAEKEGRWNDARVFYAKALALTGREDARSALYREATQPIRLALAQTLLGHDERITAVGFSPDGRRLASASWDESIILWSVDDGVRIKTFRGAGDWVTSIAYSPDGRYLMAGSGDAVLLWSVETGELVRRMKGHDSEVICVAFSPDAALAVSGSGDSNLKLWRVDTGDELMTFAGHQDWVTSVQVSPDQTQVLSGSWDKTLRLWDLKSGDCLRVFAGHQEEVTSVAFDLDQVHALSASHDRTLKIWSLQNGDCLNTLRGHEDRIYSAHFHAIGNLAISGSDDKTIKLWDIHKGERLRSFVGHDIRVCSVQFSPDGSCAASGSWDKSIKLWNIKKGEPVITLEGHQGDVACAVFSPNGRLIASGGEDMAINLWDWDEQERIRSLIGHEAPISTLAFSPDGRLLAASSWDDLIKLWRVDTGELLRTIKGHQDDIPFLAFSPDGQRLISASFDATIRVWSVAEGAMLRILTGHRYPIQAGAVSKDGKLLVTGGCDQMRGFDCESGELRFWSLETGALLKRIVGHQDSVLGVAFAPDAKTAASCSHQSIKLWDLHSGDCRLDLTGHSYYVKSVAFSPDANYLATGGEDLLLKIWSVPTGKCLLTLDGHAAAINTVAFSPNGAYLASAAKDASIKIWPVVREILDASDDQLLQNAKRETGLAIRGFKLVLNDQSNQDADDQPYFDLTEDPDPTPEPKQNST